MLRKTLNSEIMKNSSGRVRVAKKKFGSGRVAGTRQSLPLNKGNNGDEDHRDEEKGVKELSKERHFLRPRVSR